ncbi:24178_t:CDS:2, partial [Gigaspora rosea]
MSEIKKCMECKTTKSRQFRSLAGNKWEKAEANENQLRKAKQVKVSVEEVEASEVVAEPVANVAVGGVE